MHGFTHVLGLLRNGGAVVDLTAALADLVDRVRDTGRKGALVLSLEVKPAAEGDDAMLMITDTLTIKAPQPAKGATLMFASPDGGLSRRDHRQPDMFGLRDVTQPATPPPAAAPATPKESTHA